MRCRTMLVAASCGIGAGCSGDALSPDVAELVRPTGRIEVVFGAAAAERYIAALETGALRHEPMSSSRFELVPAAALGGADAVLVKATSRGERRRIRFRDDGLLDAVIGTAGALAAQVEARGDLREVRLRGRVESWGRKPGTRTAPGAHSNPNWIGAAARQLRRLSAYSPVPLDTQPEISGAAPSGGVRPFRFASFEDPAEGEVVCAPTFPSVYQHPSWLVWYRGTSIGLAGTVNAVPYEFNGRNLTGDQWASGVHHVARYQCPYTWHARLTGIPGFIAYLHNPQFGSSALPPGDGCGGGGGGEDGGGSGPTLVCEDAYIVIEISYDGGQTWQMWWEGWGTECEYED